MNAVTGRIGTQLALVCTSIQHVQPVAESAGIRHTTEKVDILLEYKIVVIFKGHHLIGTGTHFQGLDFYVPVKELGWQIWILSHDSQSWGVLPQGNIGGDHNSKDYRY